MPAARTAVNCHCKADRRHNRQRPVTLEEVIEAGDAAVLVRARFVGRVSAGVGVDRTLFYLFEIVEQKLTRLRPFDTEREALAAAATTPGT